MTLLQAILHKLPGASLFQSSDQNRRRYRRYERRTLLTIQPLDDDLSMMGAATWGMSVDISAGGIGLECNDPLDVNYLRVTIQEDAVSYIAVVRHRRETGTGWFFGVEFLEDDVCHERL